MADVTLYSHSDDYREDIHVRDHRLIADESPKLGGRDQGPNPYEHLLAGLGACTAITLRMYAGRKSWSLGAMRVELHFGRRQKGDDIEEFIHRKVHLSADLDEQQLDRLADIASKTPVTRTVGRGTPITTDFYPGSAHNNSDGA